MAKITFDRQTREDLQRLLSRRLKDSLGVELGTFEALEVLDVLTEAVGPYFYNQGLYDAQAVIKGRLDGIVEAVEAIEQPLPR